jgi:hypothetical protein
VQHAHLEDILYLCVISPKDVDIVMNPLEGGELILQTEVGGTLLLGLGARWKAKDADPIVEVDVNDWCSLGSLKFDLQKAGGSLIITRETPCWTRRVAL